MVIWESSGENQDLAAACGIRSIPDVIAFKGGEAVSHFLGATPESQIRAVVDRLMPTPSGLERAATQQGPEAGLFPAFVHY